MELISKTAPASLLAEPSEFKILYVEQDLSVELAFLRAFGSSTSITAVYDAGQAMDLLQDEYEFELVVINENVGGLDFLAQVRANPKLHALPIILTCAALSEPLRRSARDGNALDICTLDQVEEKIQLKIDYLKRKKEYVQSLAHATRDKPVKTPLGKRLFDIAFAGTVLLCLSPLLLVVAILIRLDSPGPIFYRAKRVGAGYKIFDIIKFRTMRQNADKLIASMAALNIYNKQEEETPAGMLCALCTAGGVCQKPLYLDGQRVCEDMYAQTKKGKATFVKFHQDPRVTRLGKFLRDYSIDELPQFINILNGDMSLVGNRPLAFYEAEKLTKAAYARRFAAPAGLTGLWQVSKRGRSTQFSDEERIQLDALYAYKFSMKMDLIIILKTVRALWQKESM